MVPDRIGEFIRYKGKKTTMEYGYHYSLRTRLPFDRFFRRSIRLWIPESYDFDNPKPTPVIYFSDGQNLVDYYLTAYGDWHLDRVIRELGKEGLPEPILVGIDCPKKPIKRTRELNPPYPISKRIKEGPGPMGGYANRFIGYITKVLKPYVDSLLCTDKRKIGSAIGGSSMGGIMAFYAFLSHPNDFGFSLSFSPALFFYTDSEISQFVDEANPIPGESPNLFLYVGGKDFEKEFVHATRFTYKLLLSKGFDSSNLVLEEDPKAIHHEEAWYRHSPSALRWWLEKVK